MWISCIWRNRFTHSPFGESFEKQTKTIQNHGEKKIIKAIEEHGKQLDENNALVK